MSTEETAREHLTAERQKQQQRHNSMVNRAESEVHGTIEDEKARELNTENRQDEQNRQQSMLNRAESENNQ